MGLATTYGIVKQSGGFITVESEANKGTTVRMFLPYHAAPSVARPAVAIGAPEVDELPFAAGGDETILIVEDDAAVRATTTTILERLGYVVFAAGTPTEAFETLRERADDIDVLVTDIIHPEMSGMRLGKLVAAQYPHVRIVRMSGFVGDDLAPESASLFLQKPFSVDALARAIRGALAG